MSGSLRLELKPSRYSTAVTIVFSLAVVLYWASVAQGILDVLGRAAPLSTDERVALGTLVALGLGLVWVVGRRLLPGRFAPTIDFLDAGLELPARSSGRGRASLSYAEIRAFHVIGQPPFRTAIVGGPRRAYVLAEPAFVEHDAFSRFVMELRLRIRDLPGGDARLQEMEERFAVVRGAMSRPATETHVILLLVGLAFVLEVESGALDGQWADPILLVRLGANVSRLVIEGEYWRLFTSTFLHASRMHLLLNLVALAGFGAIVERLLGTSRFLVITLGAAATGALLSALVAHSVASVGASTAIVGLLGGLLAITAKYRGRLPVGVGLSPLTWGVVLVLTAALLFASSELDVIAHAGGFAAGAAVAVALAAGRDPAALILGRVGRGSRSVAAALSAVCLMSIGYGAYQARSPDLEAEIRVVEELIERPSTPAEQLNAMAWRIATGKDATETELGLAQKAAERAVEALQAEPTVVDTLATVNYGRRDFDLAVALERDAFARERNGTYASQLARFERARLAKSGPLVVGSVTSTAGVRFVLGERNEGVRSVVVRLDDGLRTSGGEVHAVAVEDEEIVGFVEVRFGANVPEALTYGDDKSSSNVWGPDVRLIVTVVDASRPGSETGRAAWSVWRYEDEIAALPTKDASP